MDRTNAKAARKAYLKRLQNPYASLEVDEPENPADQTTNEAIKDYIRALENPYAKLSLFDETTADTNSRIRFSTAAAQPESSLSKAEFQTRCRNIFRGYVPPFEKGRIRPYHRDFIARNESRTPVERYKLFMQLAKYDLSANPGVPTYFNRERDTLTEEKLRRIEESINDKKK